MGKPGYAFSVCREKPVKIVPGCYSEWPMYLHPGMYAALGTICASTQCGPWYELADSNVVKTELCLVLSILPHDGKSNTEFFTSTDKRTRARIHAYARTQTHTDTCARTHACAHARTQAHTHTLHTHAHRHTHTREGGREINRLCLQMCACTQTHPPSPRDWKRLFGQGSPLPFNPPAEAPAGRSSEPWHP
jgi:hypothetical protein